MKMKGMILAAGLGTRLGALGEERPKPLFPVADVPLVRYALALLRGHGIADVIVNTHHLGDLLEAELGEEVAYSREEGQVLGTGGGIARAAPFFGRERCFVLNGKIVADLDLAAVVAHHERTGALATLVVRPDPDAVRWGAVDLDAATGRVRAIRGAGGHMFTGIHLLEPALVARLPAGVSDIVDAAYLPALARGEPIAAYVMEGYFWEHSTPARYLAGNINLLRGAGARLRHAPDPLVGISPRAKVAPGAQLIPPVAVGADAVVEPGARVGPDVVIGRRARVLAGAQVETAIIWPDAVVAGAVRSAVVTPKQVVKVEDSGERRRT
jgi:NDP-sugar pyrophosphorylase family protein